MTIICEIYPDKICALDAELQKNLLLSVELGLTTLGVDSVYVLCCDFLHVLVTYIIKKNRRDAPIFEAVRPFLKVWQKGIQMKDEISFESRKEESAICNIVF